MLVYDVRDVCWWLEAEPSANKSFGFFFFGGGSFLHTANEHDGVLYGKTIASNDTR